MSKIRQTPIDKKVTLKVVPAMKILSSKTDLTKPFIEKKESILKQSGNKLRQSFEKMLQSSQATDYTNRDSQSFSKMYESHQDNQQHEPQMTFQTPESLNIKLLHSPQSTCSKLDTASFIKTQTSRNSNCYETLETVSSVYKSGTGIGIEQVQNEVKRPPLPKNMKAIQKIQQQNQKPNIKQLPSNLAKQVQSQHQQQPIKSISVKRSFSSSDRSSPRSQLAAKYSYEASPSQSRNTIATRTLSNTKNSQTSSYNVANTQKMRTPFPNSDLKTKIIQNQQQNNHQQIVQNAVRGLILAKQINTKASVNNERHQTPTAKRFIKSTLQLSSSSKKSSGDKQSLKHDYFSEKTSVGRSEQDTPKWKSKISTRKTSSQSIAMKQISVDMVDKHEIINKGSFHMNTSTKPYEQINFEGELLKANNIEGVRKQKKRVFSNHQEKATHGIDLTQNQSSNDERLNTQYNINKQESLVTFNQQQKDLLSQQSILLKKNSNNSLVNNGQQYPQYLQLPHGMDLVQAINSYQRYSNNAINNLKTSDVQPFNSRISDTISFQDLELQINNMLSEKYSVIENQEEAQKSILEQSQNIQMLKLSLRTNDIDESFQNSSERRAYQTGENRIGHLMEIFADNQMSSCSSMMSINSNVNGNNANKCCTLNFKCI